MNRKLWFALVVSLAMVLSLVNVLSVAANPPAPESSTPGPTNVDRAPQQSTLGKFIDQPNTKDAQRLNERWRLLESGQTAQANALAKTGTDRVLVILAEFGGPDQFTWTAPTNPADPSTGSRWDPIAKSDPNEAVYDKNGDLVVGDCSKIITQTRTFTYSGPKHNQIPRPLSAADRSGDSIWTEDFTPSWYNNFMFGNGVAFNYQRVDGSTVNEDFTGESVAKYYGDMSSGQYTVTGDVIGWLTLPHSQMYYGGDRCPGNRSGMTSGSGADGKIPGAGGPEQLVIDALEAVDAISNTIPGFNWQNYDLDHDGVIDRLWIVHAGYGEEDGTDLLNRTLPYGEGAVWSHSSSIKRYQINQNIAASPYIMMPENGGIGVFAHESGHNLGAQDLYSYNEGEASAGFWTLMADDWTGYPIGFEPPSVDPYHLDRWGWLNPLVITDTTKTYEFTLGQTSVFPGGEGVYRGARIELPTGHVPLAVQPVGQYQWWGGKADEANSMMTLKQAVALPAGKPAALSFDLSYNTEEQWDFFWVQASTDGGQTWQTLTNANTTCEHDPSWIGGNNDFPDDLCAAKIGGFTGEGASFPAYANQVFDLSKYAGKNVLVRLWYMTDWGTTYDGAFVDNVKIAAGGSTLFADDAETSASDANWTYAADWARNDGTKSFSQNYYLQWRNVGADGGYDSALGDSRWRYGPANTGLLMWYNNNGYTDNEVINYLTDYPAFGPKGRMLVVDAHPEPYRDPYLVGQGYNNEAGNLASRMQMRDAPFSTLDSVGFTVKAPYAYTNTNFLGRSAVSVFDDAYTYYPGAELMPGGPVNQTSLRWMTKQWDASAVLPSTAFYGIKAPGYNGTDLFRFGCSLNAKGQVLCYGYPGLGFKGNDGNSGDADGAYGWHVQVVSQTSQTATVRVWNKQRSTTLATDKATAKKGEVVTYAFDVKDNATPLTLFACAPLETAKYTYIDRSVTGGAVPLPMSCATAAAALGANRTVSDLASQAGPLQSIMWTQNLAVEGGASFSYQVQPTLLKGELNPTVLLYNGAGDLWKNLSGDAVQIVPRSQFFMPLVHKR